MEFINFASQNNRQRIPDQFILSVSAADINGKMEIIRTANRLREYSLQIRESGKSIGFVPTMGALHAGHLSLVERACIENDIVIASVFVNPVQFNNAEDLEKYPRNEKADFNLLNNAGVAAVFAPSIYEVYSKDDDTEGHIYNLGEIAEVMEGKYRPGHFQGVARIVDKLLRWSSPNRAYFGEKDFQQIAVIRRMITTENINVEIVTCPIVREIDGLALSSRNSRLTTEQRAIAPEIYETLRDSVQYSLSHNVYATRNSVIERINALPGCEVEYFSIVDATNLREITEWNDATEIIGCITVYCGNVRLIDNIAYRKNTILQKSC